MIVLTLAFAIAAVSSAFSILYVTIFAPFPYANADRIVMLREFDQRSGAFGNSRRDAQQMRERTTAFESMVDFESGVRMSELGLGEPR